MAQSSVNTPQTTVSATTLKTPSAVNTLLRSLLRGTPYRTPDRRRFGPVGSKRKTSSALRRRSGETPLNARVAPQVRGLEMSQEEESRSEEEENNIKELWNKPWRVYRVTPLYNYHTKSSDFKYYSSSLSSHVAAETKKGTFVDTTLPGEATVGTIGGLDTGEVDERALLIEIQGQRRNRSKKTMSTLRSGEPQARGHEPRSEEEENIVKEIEKTVIFQSVLFSTDLEYNPLKPTVQDKFTYFPVMLVNGTEVLSQTIQNWLEIQFDCRVVPMTFTSHELVFMAAMFTGFGEVHKPVDLVYQVPAEVEGLSTIDYSTAGQDSLKLWNSVRSSEDEVFTAKEAEMFISALESHFYGCFKIKLHAMPLSTVGTSIAFVNREGKIKFYTRSIENTLKVLRHLTDLALDQIKAL